MTTDAALRSRARSLDWRFVWRWANYVAVPLVLLWTGAHLGPSRPVSDDLSYWLTGHETELYAIPWNTAPQAYIYSPVFAQMIYPLTQLSFESFHVVLLVAQVALMVWLVGPAISALYLYSFLGQVNVQNGNINVLLPAMLAIEAWPVILLTKVTPGVGILWYPLRGEWRRLALLLAITGAVVAVSFTFAPSLWADWIAALQTATGSRLKGFPVPLAVRVPLAALVVAWGARTDRRWTLAPAAWLAMPDMGWSGASWLLAMPRLGLGAQVPRPR